MKIREFTKSGAFVAIVFVLVVVLVPFGIEQVAETTGWFNFPVKKTITGWFAGMGGRSPLTAGKGAVAASVDWERYRQDLEAFTQWVGGQDVADIFLPPPEEAIKVEEDEEEPERRIWPVPVVSCTAADPMGRKKGYVFISGIDHRLEEGAVIAPFEDLCGYEIICVAERSVWFRVVLESEGDMPMGSVKFPEFTRVDGDSIVMGHRRYVARDAFPLKSGGWLMIDSFMPPDGAVFKILDESRYVVATILCVVIGEKGGK